MYNLPLESKLDVLKYLNIEQLTSFRQTNRYFNALIGRYEEELARQELDIIDFDNVYPHVDYEFINIEDGVFKLKMNNQLKKKWRSALNRQIPPYLNITDYNKKTIKLREVGYYNQYLLDLPIILKNMEEIKIIRCWIEKISRCYFEQINFLSTVINPEMIHLIFDNEEIDKIKFSCNSSHYSYVYDESVFLFYLNRLFINEDILLFSKNIDNTFKQNSINILVKFLLKIPHVRIVNLLQSTLCEQILNHIETSKDYSNMATFWESFTLSERAELIGEYHHDLYYPSYTYELTNMHNPNVKFSIWTKKNWDGDTVGFIIHRSGK